MKLSSKATGSQGLRDQLTQASTLLVEASRSKNTLGEYSKRVLGTENFNAGDAEASSASIETMIGKSAFLGGASANAKETARILMAAVADPSAYARVLGNESFSDKEYANAEGYSSDTVLNTEYFSDRDLAKHLEKSMVLSVRVSQQTPYAEKMYKTIIIDPSDTGATFRAKKLRVHRGARHTLLTEKARAFKPRNAIDALTDPTILKGDDLALVPFMPVDGSADDHFVAKDLFAPSTVDVAGHEIRTSFLNFDKSERNILSLCSNPVLLGNNVLNENDEIAEGMALHSILVNVRKKGEAVAAGKFIVLNTLNMSFAGLDKTTQGGGREMQLSFRKNLFSLDGNTKDFFGADIPALAPLLGNEMQVQYEVVFTTYVDVSLGEEKLSKPTVHKRKVVDVNGTAQKIEGSIATMLDNVIIEPVGYKYAATLTNENKRQFGLLADAYWFEENYKIRLGDPVTTRTPPNGVEVDDSSKLEDLISLINIRNENLAVERTIEYTDTLREVVKGIRNDFDDEPAPISGIARHFIRPWLEEDEFDVAKVTNTFTTITDVENARAALVNLIRAQLAVAFQKSRYLTALRATSGCHDKQAKVLITTDTVVADLLQIMGDTRLVGTHIDCDVVTTNDLRYYPIDTATGEVVRRLQWVLTVDGDGDDYQIYGWGSHLWCPPLVSNTQLTREGSTTQELTVQPRNLHVVNCPITGIIHVRGLDNWMKVRKSIAVEIANKKLAIEDVTTPSVA